MKKIVTLTAILGILSLALVTPVNAVTTTGAITVKAIITASTPDMAFELHKLNDGDPDNDPWTGYSVVSNMDFDKWNVITRPTKNPQWTSVTKHTLIVWATGMGDAYEILSDGSGSFTGPGGTLPTGCFMVAPIYAPEDEWWEDVDGDGVKDPGETYQQGAMPAGALKGTQGNAITTGKSVYASETPVGSARIIQVMYMFPAYNIDGSVPYTGYAPIPSTQAAGTYTGGSVTVRIIAK